jgi:type VI secretion system protein ImpH
MPTEKRRIEPPVINRLFEEPYRFDYFQAVRILELWLRRRGVAQADVVNHFLRFENSTSLGFPASQLEAIATEPRELAHDAPALATAVQNSTLRYIRVRPAFMGLLSGTGVLPAHYTERIAEHELHHKDNGPRAFLDALSNRSLALFYGAWKKYRLALRCESRNEDDFLPLLLDLAGLGNRAPRTRKHARETGGVQAASIGYFAASIRHRPVSAVQIARVLSEYFGRPVQAEQFIGAWYAIPAAQQSMLGHPNATLGATAISGARVWQRDLRLRLIIGPLDTIGFSSFLPDGTAARALRTLLALFTGLTLEYEIELVLRAADVCSVTLGDDHAGRLGWNAYLVDGPQHRDRRDVCYDIELT